LDGDEKEIHIKSRVSISIGDINLDTKDIVRAQMANKNAVKDDVIPGYVLFPITSEVKADKEIHIIKTLEFSLSLNFPQKLEPVILDTLKLWTLFGGVGARTRRGTGSLYCEELLNEFQDEQDIFRFIKKAVTKKETCDKLKQLQYPRLNGFQFYAALVKDVAPPAAWHNLLENYGRYRQDRRPGSGKKKGRSYWPEPDAIRRLTKDYSTDHKPKHTDENWFPRAAMGLPIITMFISPGDPGNKVGEKRKTITLEPDIGTGGRLPSPVILKVIQLPNKGVLKCALVLNQLFPERLKLGLDKWSQAVEGDMLPFHKDYRKHKIMNTKNPLKGRSIYQSLADHLALQEVK
jgi:CRISPR-associated protein Cmr1